MTAQRWIWAVVCPRHGIVEDYDEEPSESVYLCSFVEAGILCPRRCEVERRLAAEVVERSWEVPTPAVAEAPRALSPVEVARQFRQQMGGRS